MRSVVSGVAGFVGSHLAERLLSSGDEVVGIDCVTDYYDVRRKEANLDVLHGWDGFRLIRADVRHAALDQALSGADVIYHLAGQPGVRPSWGRQFETYVQHNVMATQVLLEAARDLPLHKFVYASSSSIYGDAESYPTHEQMRPRPVSPYGVTKLAGEHLCELYRTVWKVRTASLRLFTVFGPRQRPDMAFSRLVSAAVRSEPFELYGDGTQTRDFTYVDDVVSAFHQAALSEWTGVANVGGGSRVAMEEVVRLVKELAGGLQVVPGPAQKGDVRHTAADISVARAAFGYQPSVSVRQGLARMVDAERGVDQRAATTSGTQVDGSE